MKEMLDEVEAIISIKTQNVKRYKKGLDLSYVSQYGRYFTVCMELKSLETWETCLRLIHKYKLVRSDVQYDSKSKYFQSVMTMERREYPGVITEKTRNEIIEYMKLLEWKLEQFTNEKT
ncbi:hypothetical protein [Paenibacillus sp. R14(2021)]|uniref:hypothetical protein n=1 Tax=Paenibacillus sp. R14(2021) TaxID=2859228 RepID=UPI001C614921|nr:hypothetical protein [Paenibacillus sp. R14(2021)]